MNSHSTPKLNHIPNDSIVFGRGGAKGEPRPMRKQPVGQNIPHYRSDQQRDHQSAPVAPIQHGQQAEYEARGNFRDVQDRHVMEIETAVERDETRTLKRLQYGKRNDRPENCVSVAEMEKVAERTREQNQNQADQQAAHEVGRE